MLIVFELLNEIFKYLCVYARAHPGFIWARAPPVRQSGCEFVCVHVIYMLILDAKNWALNILLEQMAIFAYQ